MKKITLFVLSSLLLGCSVPVGNINQSIEKTEIKNDKQFETKSLARFEHPNRAAEFNDSVYHYALPGITGDLYNHYNSYARDSLYQSTIRSPAYYTALKCVAEGFDETSYRNANPDVNAAINNNQLASAYAHYSTVRVGEPARVNSASYRAALKTNKVFREEAYFNANPGLHPGIKFTLDNNFTSTAYPANGYEYYVTTKFSGTDTLNNATYQTALNDHVDGYWEDSYLYAFGDIRQAVDGNPANGAQPSLPTGYSHYNPYGRNENRLANTSYTQAVLPSIEMIHPGESKAVDFDEGILGSNPSTANQKRGYKFNVLSGRKYRFLLSEMSQGDAYITIKNSAGNIVQRNSVNIENDDRFGLDAYVEFDSTTSIQQNFIDRYTVEVTTSNNGVASTTPSGKFVLTMFHVFKN